jgi:hypothetical protein
LEWFHDQRQAGANANEGIHQKRFKSDCNNPQPCCTLADHTPFTQVIREPDLIPNLNHGLVNGIESASITVSFNGSDCAQGQGMEFHTNAMLHDIRLSQFTAVCTTFPHGQFLDNA